MNRKQVIEKYLKLGLWFALNMESKEYSIEHFYQVSEKIGQLENELIAMGVSESAIQRLNNYSEQLYKTPIDQLSPNAQLRMCKIIFGEGTKKNRND